MKQNLPCLISIIKGYYVSYYGANDTQSCAEGYYAVDLDSIGTDTTDCNTNYAPGNTDPNMCPEEYPICFSPGGGQDNYCSNVCSYCPPGMCNHFI